MVQPDQGRYVSRAGIKLAHALREFRLDVTGLVCADFGCHVGGFTDCLLQHGAARVYAVDTGYGVLDYRLRIDDRVIVLERTNVLHEGTPEEAVDLVTVDLGWTRQRHAVPAALRWLKPTGRIVTLVKPHYEVDDKRGDSGGLLSPKQAESVLARVLDELPALGVEVVASTRSPIRGAKSARRRGCEGNVEFLVLATPGRGRA